MDGIPTYRTDQELPGIPLAWLKSDGRSPIELQSMGAILKFQIVRSKALVVQQTTYLTADDAVPNWTMERFDAATLTAIEAELDGRDCGEAVYDFVPMYRRTADTADDIFDPENNGFPVRFTRAPV